MRRLPVVSASEVHARRTRAVSVDPLHAGVVEPAGRPPAPRRHDPRCSRRSRVTNPALLDATTPAPTRHPPPSTALARPKHPRTSSVTRPLQVTAGTARDSDRPGPARPAAPPSAGVVSATGGFVRLGRSQAPSAQARAGWHAEKTLALHCRHRSYSTPAVRPRCRDRITPGVTREREMDQMGSAAVASVGVAGSAGAEPWSTDAVAEARSDSRGRPSLPTTADADRTDGLDRAVAGRTESRHRRTPDTTSRNPSTVD